MKIGIPKERKFEEKRVALAPAGVDSLIRAGHTVYIEKGAGVGCHFSDSEYEDLGAHIVYTAEEVFLRSDIVVKINQLIEEECELLRENQTLFSFLHLVTSGKKVLNSLLDKKVTAISYELIEQQGELPILHSMSEIAGQICVQVAESLLESSNHGGRGVLIGGIAGVAPAAIVIIGAGVVGSFAVRSAIGRGASVIVLDQDLNQLRKIDAMYQKRVTTVVANPYTIARGVKFADVLIGAVMKKAAKSPHVVTEAMVKTMKKGAVIVDVSIDQGGCVETSRPTTLSNPVFISHGVIHYCVPNMPAKVSRTASFGLTNATLPYIMKIAEKGLMPALGEDQGLLAGVCTFNGSCSNEIIADTFNVEYRRIHLFSKN
jgi:alanine dehydrogenase